MKKVSLRFIVLAVAILLSLALSYLLIFVPSMITQWVRPNQETAQINIQNDDQQLVSDYYKVANVRLSEILYPTNVIVSQNNQAYLLNNYATLQQLVALLSQRRITVEGSIVSPSEEEYVTLITQPRIEFGFSHIVPSSLTEHFLKNDGDVTQFYYNRIIIPQSQTKDQVYLVNTLDQTYMLAHLAQGVSSSDYLTIARQVQEDWVPVQRYNLSTGNHVYLPEEEMSVDSQVYTLNIVPENNITRTLFGNSRIWRFVSENEEDLGDTIKYQNSNIEMTLNSETQMLEIMYKNITQSDLSNDAQKIEQAYSQVRQYEYWQHGLRYASQSSVNSIVFQRYLDGIPIFSPMDQTHYASNRVSFKTGNLITSSATLVMPLLYLEAHVADQSRSYDLVAGDELEALLNSVGLSLGDFSNVMIGYEWQANMANFQKVSFVPKWYLERGNQYYSIDKILEGAISNTTTFNTEQEQYVDEQMGG